MSDDERPKRSWSEIDRMRDGAVRRDERRPKGPAAEARARGATDQYLKKLDATLFAAGKRGGSAGDPLGKAVFDARGSADFDARCRVYLDEVGPPADASLISAFLDAHEKQIRVEALVALSAQVDAGLEPERGLRDRVRVLADDFDDALAAAAEDEGQPPAQAMLHYAAMRHYRAQGKPHYDLGGAEGAVPDPADPN